MTGNAIYFDGATAARHDVTVDLDVSVIRIRAADGKVLAEWPYDQIEPLSAPDGVLRIGRAGSPVLARLEVHDPALAAAIDDRSVPVDRSGKSERRERTRVVGWSIAATVSLIAVAVLGVPEIANRLAPLVPWSVERKFGTAIEAQIRRSSMNATRAPHSSAGIPRGKNQDAWRSTSSWPRSRRQPPSPFRSMPPWCAATKPTPSRCRAGASTCSRA